MANASDEKRKDTRVPLLIRIQHSAVPGRVDVTENLSAGGLFVRTDRVLAPGTRTPLLLSFPGLLEPIQIEVEVIWARPAQPGVPAGLAVRIPDGRDEDREKLARLVRAAENPSPPDRPYRILLVEDDELIATIYDGALQGLRGEDGRLGVTVERARDGVEALFRVRRADPPDLIVVDLYMPMMDGFAFVEQVRCDPRVMALPIVAISAGGDEARARALAAGVDVFLTKPVKFAEVVSTVRALLRLR